MIGMYGITVCDTERGSVDKRSWVLSVCVVRGRGSVSNRISGGIAKRCGNRNLNGFRAAENKENKRIMIQRVEQKQAGIIVAVGVCTWVCGRWKAPAAG